LDTMVNGGSHSDMVERTGPERPAAHHETDGSWGV
jgi:hypothetical protein